VERVYDFKDVLEERKAKLVALSLESMPRSGGSTYVPNKLS